MIKKRGVSAVVATVLIILVTIASVGIVARFVVPFVKNNLQEGSECVPYRGYLAIDPSFDLTCYNVSSTSFKYGITVKASGKASLAENMKGIQIVLSSRSNGESNSLKVLEGSASSSDVNGVKMLDSESAIEIPKAGETRTYVVNGGNKAYSILEIYPVLENGRVCERSDKVDVDLCLPGVALT